MKLFQFLRDWSEVWALLIPLIVILAYKPKGKNLGWLIGYVFIAFILNFMAVFMIEYSSLVPSWLSKGNNIFYNLHSFIMTLFFGWYIINVKTHSYTILLKCVLSLYLAFVLINFSAWESPMILSTRHFAVGSIITLIMGLSYFLYTLLEESQGNWLKHPSFIICSGICLYEAVTFFIFLFIYPMFSKTYNRDLSFAREMIKVYQAIFVIFCILLAIGLYKYRGKRKNHLNA